MPNEEVIIIDWVNPEGKNPVVIKESKSLIWKILKYIFIFLTGFFFGIITTILIYH